MLERALRPGAIASLRCAYTLGQKAYNAREGIETSAICACRIATCSTSQKAYNAREGIETTKRAVRAQPDFDDGQKAYNAREGIET